MEECLRIYCRWIAPRRPVPWPQALLLWTMMYYTAQKQMWIKKMAEWIRLYQDHCTRSLYQIIVPDHCTRSLYQIIVPDHCTRSLYQDHCTKIIVPDHCTRSLYQIIVPRSLCQIIVPDHCTRSLYQIIVPDHSPLFINHNNFYNKMKAIVFLHISNLLIILSKWNVNVEKS